MIKDKERMLGKFKTLSFPHYIDSALIAHYIVNTGRVKENLKISQSPFEEGKFYQSGRRRNTQVLSQQISKNVLQLEAMDFQV